MASIRQDVTCPHCKKKLRFRFNDELNKDDIACYILRKMFSLYPDKIKERYGIDWQSPADKNPGMKFD